MITRILTEEIFSSLQRSIIYFSSNSQVLRDDSSCIFVYPPLKYIVKMKLKKKKKGLTFKPNQIIFSFSSKF